jgi:hypothetical protein
MGRTIHALHEIVKSCWLALLAAEGIVLAPGTPCRDDRPR